MFGVRTRGRGSFDLDRGALRIGSASALEDEVSGALTRLQRGPTGVVAAVVEGLRRSGQLCGR